MSATGDAHALGTAGASMDAHARSDTLRSQNGHRSNPFCFFRGAHRHSGPPRLPTPTRREAPRACPCLCGIQGLLAWVRDAESALEAATLGRDQVATLRFSAFAGANGPPPSPLPALLNRLQRRTPSLRSSGPALLLARYLTCPCQRCPLKAFSCLHHHQRGLVESPSMGKRRPHARRHLSSRRHAALPGPSLPGSAPASPWHWRPAQQAPDPSAVPPSAAEAHRRPGNAKLSFGYFGGRAPTPSLAAQARRPG